MTVSRSYRPVWKLVVILAAIQALYGAAYIWRASFVVENRRYFCLFDDAMISMRFADNAARGLGLVWNAGERVEGYTNLSWTLLLAVIHLLPLAPEHVCLVVQILGVALWIGCTAATARLAHACRLTPVAAMGAVALTASHYNLMFFSIMGMETGLLTLTMTLGAAAVARALHERRGELNSTPWFATAVLTRMDVIPVIGCVYALEFIFARRARGAALASAGLVAAVVAGHFFWRHSYYGDWFPNTYYLKATGWPIADRIVPGLEQCIWAVMAFGLPFALSLLALRKLRRLAALLLGPFAMLVAYQIYVGGDAWPLNRFLIPASCGLFVSAAAGVEAAFRSYIANRTRTSAIAMRAGAFGLCMFLINAIHLEHWTLIEPAQTTPENRMNVRLAHAIDKISGNQATLAVVFAGVTPYFSRRTCFDLLGKCDPHIAHMPAKPGFLRAGHNKFDFNWSLSTHRPEILLNAFVPGETEVRKGYLPVKVEIDGEPLTFFVRRDSLSATRAVRISADEAVKIYSQQVSNSNLAFQIDK